MKAIFKIAILAAAIGFGPAAFAQAKTDVKVNGKIDQEQAATEGKSIQHMDLGTIKSGNGSSNVTVTGRIWQRQAYTDDTLQALDIGSVEGNGSSNVVVNNVNQYQNFSENDAHQVMQIGTVKGTGNTKVFVNTVNQTQSGADKSQQEMRIGVIR